MAPWIAQGGLDAFEMRGCGFHHVYVAAVVVFGAVEDLLDGALE